MIGDWMGSQYSIGGQRLDLFLFLDHDGRFERTVRFEPAGERKDYGSWTYDEKDNLLELVPDTRGEMPGMIGNRWRVLSVTTCEASNVLLVLREAILASRNLPIVLYRVHCNHRGYGSGWERRHQENLASQSADSN
jgi:hypothetical protein